MKQVTLSLAIFLLTGYSFGQITIGKIKRGVKETKEVLNSGEEEEETEEESESKSEETSEESMSSESGGTENKEKEKLTLWTKFDFVPGDSILFQDNQENEEVGEFPSKWDLATGNAEMAVLGEQDVIQLVSQGTSITPLMKTKEYLPEVFTIEFDLYSSELMPSYKVYLYDMKQYKKDWRSVETIDFINIGSDETKMGDYKSDYDILEKDAWHHISIAFNKRSLKLYINETRVLNIPNLEFKPKAFSLGTGGAYAREETDIWLFKNVKIAEGGKDLYNREVTDGKIVTNGILFDIGKATIKPQSMGVINKIYKIMDGNDEINFTVVGHTDNTGNDESNMELSKARAESVKNKLIEMGIDAGRLKSDGKGESEPVADNDTSEGRAMNRRVEFIKF